MATKRADELQPGDRIKFGLSVRTVNAVDVTPHCVTVHLLTDGPNTPTAWSAGRTRAITKLPSQHVIIADAD